MHNHDPHGIDKATKQYIAYRFGSGSFDDHNNRPVNLDVVGGCATLIAVIFIGITALWLISLLLFGGN